MIIYIGISIFMTVFADWNKSDLVVDYCIIICQLFD